MRRSFVMCVMAAVVLVPVTACTSDDGSKPPETARGRPASSDAGGRQGSAVDPPELDGTAEVAGRRGGAHGNASFGYERGTPGDALIVAVRCEGKGAMRVALTAGGVSFPVECLSGDAETTYHQVAVGGVQKAGTVRVTAPTAVNWAMTVGRGRPATAE